MSELELFRKRIAQAQQLRDDGKADEAEAMAEEAARGCPQAWVELGCQYLDAKDYDTAGPIFAKTVSITQDRRLIGCALNNLGMIANERGDRDLAAGLFAESLVCDETPMAHSNLGLYEFWHGRYDTAIKQYDKALRLDPHFIDAEFNRTLWHLKVGDWREGWRGYECRFRKIKGSLRKLEVNKPIWNGKPIKHLLVVGEQGRGDMIMAARLAAVLAASGVERQTWIVQSGLSSILNTIQHITAIEDLDKAEPFDAHINAMSLFHVLGINRDSVASSPYVPKPADAIDYGPGRHVGIVWKGSSEYVNNIWRSARLDEWRELIEVPGVTFHALQVGGEDEALLFPQVKQYPAPPADWVDTARRMANLDLIVSIDTGPAHLAGAMGLPLYLVLPFSGEWRWGTDPDCTLWYPSARLFRMQRDGDWQGVIHRVAKAL